MNRPKRPTPPPLTKTERQALEDLIRRGARALNPAEGNRLLRLLELDQGDRAQERRTAGALMAQVQQFGGQLKDMTAERDRLAARVPLICCDERHEAKVRGLEAQLAELHEGEEPYEDERVVPTPGQWIWLWNRATSERRLDVAAQWRHMADTVDRCTAGLHNARIAELADLQRDWSTQRQQVARLTVDRDRLAHELRAAEDELAVHRQRAAGQAAVCCRCGSTEVVYRNYLEQPLCCPCAGCCPRPAEDRAERYRLAWQSARRRAAVADAELATLEANEAWRSAWPYTAILRAWRPEHLGAVFGEDAQSWWAGRAEEDRQRDLVHQRIADQLPVTPAPMPLPSEEQMRERVRQTLGVAKLPAAADMVDLVAIAREQQDRAMAQATWNALLYGPRTAAPEPEHECRVWEEEGEWNVSCRACDAYVDNVGNESDAEEWADDHREVGAQDCGCWTSGCSHQPESQP